MQIAIRPASIADAECIARFNRGIALETEDHDLDEDIVGPGVLRLLENPDNGRYWLAELDDRVVGQIMVTYEWSDWRNGRVWWIQSVYVHPDFRRRGVFAALYRHVERLAGEDADVCGLRLYVEENNERAQQTYLSLGMGMSPYRVMETMFAEQRDGES